MAAAAEAKATETTAATTTTATAVAEVSGSRVKFELCSIYKQALSKYETNFLHHTAFKQLSFSPFKAFLSNTQHSDFLLASFSIIGKQFIGQHVRHC